MIHFENLMKVKDTRSYGNYTAIAQYNGSIKIEIDIYLYSTLICVIGLRNHTFELSNYGWTTNTTLKALKEWKEYLQDLGFKLIDLQFSGTISNSCNLAVRVPAKAHQGGYVINMDNNSTLQCNHIGRRTDRQLKSLSVDEFYIDSPTKYSLAVQPRGCYMRGRNEKEITQSVKEHTGVEFTLNFNLSEPPEMYGIWLHHNEQLYLFKFKVRKIAYYKDFKSLNATYTAVEMYKSVDKSSLCLLRLMGFENIAYNVYKNMLNKFIQLV